MHTSQELENFLVQTAAFKGKSWSLILQGLGWGAPVHLIICGCWQQICPASWNCGHWIFLTAKCWTCCFKHLYILEVQGVVGCLADFPPSGLIACSFLPPANTSRESACHTEEPLARDRVLSLRTSSLTSPFVTHPLPPIFSVWCLVSAGEHSSVTLHPGF